MSNIITIHNLENFPLRDRFYGGYGAPVPILGSVSGPMPEPGPGFHRFYGGHGRYGYGTNLYPSYGSAFYDYPYESNYNYYPFNPCNCSQFESPSMCSRRRNGYGCL